MHSRGRNWGPRWDLEEAPASRTSEGREIGRGIRLPSRSVGESITSDYRSYAAVRLVLMAIAGGALTFAIAGATVAFGGTAADEVPAITHLAASPSKFCAKKSRSCTHPGTTLRFTLSTGARVRADIRPRSRYVGSYVEFV